MTREEKAKEMMRILNEALELEIRMRMELAKNLERLQAQLAALPPVE